MTIARFYKGRRWLVACLLVVAAIAGVLTNAPRLGLLGSDPIRMFPAPIHAPSGRPRLAAVFFSGDMGFHFGIGADVASAVAARGVPVLGVSSPVTFADRKTRAEAHDIVASAIRLALARTGADKVLLMGQSYGADIVATIAPGLPPDLRARIAAIDLTVPSRSVYFRADPSELAYLGAPDAQPLAGMRKLDWAPVVCVYGVEEPDSLCPSLSGTGAQVFGLPGGHHLRRDEGQVIATTLAALRTAVPGAGL